MRRERGSETRVSVGVDIAACLLCTEHSVSQCLRRLVGKLPCAESFQPCLSFVERTLRRTSCLIQLFLQLVDERHFRLLLNDLSENTLSFTCKFREQ